MDTKVQFDRSLKVILGSREDFAGDKILVPAKYTDVSQNSKYGVKSISPRYNASLGKLHSFFKMRYYLFTLDWLKDRDNHILILQTVKHPSKHLTFFTSLNWCKNDFIIWWLSRVSKKLSWDGMPVHQAIKE